MVRLKQSFWGIFAAYFIVEVSISVYLFTLHFTLFNLPVNGRFLPVAMLLLPYLIAIILLAFLVARCFRRREEAILFLLWSSIPLLMISGLSLPREALPEWLFALGNLIPSSPAIRGFIRTHTMGAGVREILPELLHLWVLVLLYGVLLSLFRSRKLTSKD